VRIHTVSLLLVAMFTGGSVFCDETNSTVKSGDVASAKAPDKLREIPAKYCGEFFLHERQEGLGITARPSELISPATAFCRIGPREVKLTSGEILSLTQITQPNLNGAWNPSLQVGFVSSSGRQCDWFFMEKPDFTLDIIQYNVHGQGNAPTYLRFGICQSPDTLRYCNARGLRLDGTTIGSPSIRERRLKTSSKVGVLLVGIICVVFCVVRYRIWQLFWPLDLDNPRDRFRLYFGTWGGCCFLWDY
jgi:hypothetical protein